MTPIDFNGLDTHVHGPIRLGILTALHRSMEAPRFHDVEEALGDMPTAAPSTSHLKRLEENGYVASKKAFVGLRPKTTYRMTNAGRKALSGYLRAMRQLLDALAGAE